MAASHGKSLMRERRFPAPAGGIVLSNARPRFHMTPHQAARASGSVGAKPSGTRIAASPEAVRSSRPGSARSWRCAGRRTQRRYRRRSSRARGCGCISRPTSRAPARAGMRGAVIPPVGKPHVDFIDRASSPIPRAPGGAGRLRDEALSIDEACARTFAGGGPRLDRAGRCDSAGIAVSADANLAITACVEGRRRCCGDAVSRRCLSRQSTDRQGFALVVAIALLAGCVLALLSARAGTDRSSRQDQQARASAIDVKPRSAKCCPDAGRVRLHECRAREVRASALLEERRC